MTGHAQVPEKPAGSGLTLAGRQLRYLVAAGVNTLFGLAIYPLLLWASHYLREHYMVGLLIAQAVSLVFAFVNYKFGVFRTRGGYGREVTAFGAFYIANFAANWAALPLLVRFVRLSPIIAQLLFSFLVMITSYFWHSRVTFRKEQ